MGNSNGRENENLETDLIKFAEERGQRNAERAEVERLRIAQLLDTDPSDIVWLKSGLGAQSSQFKLGGDRWGSCFVKGSKLYDDDDLQQLQMLMSEAHGFDGESSVAKRPDTTVLLKREREFLRTWWKAKTGGLLSLPEDSLLRIPKVIEPVFVNHEVQLEEESSPTFVVFEDLTTKGFVPATRKEPLSVEDGNAIAVALADLHYGMFQIRDNLIASTEELQREVVKNAVEANETNDKVIGLIRSMVESFVNELKCSSCNDEYDFFSSRIDEVVKVMTSSQDYKMFVHGDPLVENMMLKRDEEGKIIQIAFVDFATVTQQSPLFDVIGFLFTSIHSDNSQASIWSCLTQHYKVRVMELFPDDELPHDDTGSVRYSSHDVLTSVARLLHYFKSDIGWSDTTELVFRKFTVVLFLRKLLEERD